jgi:Zn-dependent peptidase ImmA (M78 family)
MRKIGFADWYQKREVNGGTMVQPRDHIKVTAQRLLKDAGITSAPIDIEALAVRQGAVVSYEPFKEELSGILIKEKDRTVIGVNSSHPRTRQRFTIAHELAHLALNHKGELFVDQTVKSQSTVIRRDGVSSQAVDRAEIEANRFAAELLMPEALIVEAVRQRQEKRPDYPSNFLIDDLARAFEVSPQAMEYRLTNLGIFIPR